ncbi:hypothetical protein M0804_001054 [Polistes exclamans]|nr:hypothetical protein M0804_001054 [Polistes exclamans]
MAAVHISAISVEVRISQPSRTLESLILRFNPHGKIHVPTTYVNQYFASTRFPNNDLGGGEALSRYDNDKSK